MKEAHAADKAVFQARLDSQASLVDSLKEQLKAQKEESCVHKKELTVLRAERDDQKDAVQKLTQVKCHLRTKSVAWSLSAGTEP